MSEIGITTAPASVQTAFAATTRLDSGFKRHSRRRARRSLLIGIAFVLPTFALLGYFMYYPAFVALVGSFQEWDGFNAPVWIGFDNLSRLFQDSDMGAAAINNVLWAVGKIILSIVPPFIVAELIFHVRSGRWRYIYRTLFVIPIVVPSIVTILTWSFYYKSDGLVNQVLGFLGLQSLQHTWLAEQGTALPALILMGFPWIAPFSLLIFYAGLQSIPKEILEAAELDGARGWQRINQLHIPMLKPQTSLLLVLAIIGSVQAILEPLIMTNGGPNNSTLTPILYLYQTGINYGEFGYSMAMSMLLFLIVLGLSVLSNRLLKSTN